MAEFNVVRQLTRLALDTPFETLDALLHPATVTIQATE
ncbi:hypothetical protein MGWOODY_XGa585 [hydrothermal vent metagenome]|uniref:Uncharacterized protein n=1 Tax=hydrothermal vent metagenome TaxID=652676 RepID=A0A160TV48_9ZZZZ